MYLSSIKESKQVLINSLGRYKEDAVKCLDKVIEINPNNVNAWFDKKVNLGL
jgi:hypothetical protein